MPAGRFNENRERTGYDERGGITEERCGRDAAPTMWRGHLAALETPATQGLQFKGPPAKKVSAGRCWAHYFIRGSSEVVASDRF